MIGVLKCNYNVTSERLCSFTGCLAENSIFWSKLPNMRLWAARYMRTLFFGILTDFHWHKQFRSTHLPITGPSPIQRAGSTSLASVPVGHTDRGRKLCWSFNIFKKHSNEDTGNMTLWWTTCSRNCFGPSWIMEQSSWSEELLTQISLGSGVWGGILLGKWRLHQRK